MSLSFLLTIMLVTVLSCRALLRTSSPKFPTASRLYSKLNFYNVGEEELKVVMKEWSQPSFRVGQIRRWVYENGVIDFNQMDDLPKTLRSKLDEFYTFGSLSLASELVSKDGTRKRAYYLGDKQLIESVLMPYDDGRYTACISSQAGCAM